MPSAVPISPIALTITGKTVQQREFHRIVAPPSTSVKTQSGRERGLGGTGEFRLGRDTTAAFETAV